MTRRTRRGTAVIYSLGLIALLSTLGSAILIRSLNESQLASRSAARQCAFFLAEAGVDRALVNLQTPTDATDDVTSGALVTGTYQIPSPPVSLGSQLWRVTVQGSASQEQRHIEAVVQLSPQSIFQFALFGDQTVSVSGHATTDSYDSRNGLYNGSAHGHNGDVGTNATAAGGIAVGGSIFVDGQLVVGPTVSNPSSVVTGFNPAFVTGGTSPPSDTQDVVSAPRSFPMSPVSAAGLTCAAFTVTGNTTKTLPADAPAGACVGQTCCFTNLTVQGSGTLTASSQVTVYVTGELSAKGDSLIGVSSEPKRMLFLLTNDSDATLEEGTLTGSTQFYGGIYGPQSTIKITGNAEIFGSVIAERVNVTGSAVIHYDEGLTQQTQISNLFTTAITSWRELTN